MIPPNIPKKAPPKGTKEHSAQLRMETLLVPLIEQRMGIKEFARAAGVVEATATEFLREKARAFSTVNAQRLLKLTPVHAFALNNTAVRQLERLAHLSDIPLHSWTQAEYALERHSLACLKSVTPWLIQAAGACPETIMPLSHDAPGHPHSPDSPAPELSDGL